MIMTRTKSGDNLDFTRVADLVLSTATCKMSLLVKSQQLGCDFREDDGFPNQQLSCPNQG
jgi:hypothetical protein